MVTTTTKRRMQYVTFNLVSIVLITLLVAKVECLRTNSMGTQFVVAFLQNEQASATTSIFVSAYTTTNVKIYSQRSGFSTLSYTIAAGTVKYVALGSNFLSTTASYTTYYIEADQLVTVSAINQQTATTDAFLVYPIDIPDPTSFRVLSYTSSLGYPSVLGIVATQSNTIVSISYSSTAGISSPTSIALNQYQGIEIGSTGDLTGTLITSNYPIVVFGGNLCTNVPSSVTYCDHIVEQMMPTSTWGKSFYTVPVPTRKSYDVFRAVAHLDQTSIYINDVFQKTINAGQYYEFQRSSTSYSKISADKIVSLAQYCVGTAADGILSDPFMTVVPPAEQYLSSYLVNTPVGGTSFSNYLSVIVDSQYSSGLLLDGNTLSMSWNQIGSTSYVGASIALTAGSHSITHKLPVVQFGVLLTGFNSAESYGYAGGLRLSPIAVECVKTTTVIDDGIDNDCDGRIDEEYLNGIDEDGDGLIDEDLVSAPNCDDGNACTYDYFDGSHCQHSTITCNDGNACTSDSCNTASGCVYTPFSGGSCNDGNACTSGDTCSSGTCVGSPITCNDGNACTSDSCNTASGCVFTPFSGGSCNDGNACTSGDTCSSGTCVGSPITCNDGNVCTSDSCNTASGCVFTALSGTPCTDGSVCTVNDQCSSGVCIPGAALSCDDSVACTVDTCDPISGCQHTPNNGNCDDSISCTTNICDAVRNCLYEPVNSNCPTGPYCTSPVCSALTGCGLSTNDALCPEDQYACTTAVCTVANGCGFTTDNIKCDDGFQCTTDICTVASGCQYTPVNSRCNDNIACTVDTCGVGVGCIFTPVDSNCNDNLVCTDDFCNSKNGCEYVTYNSRCNDYDQCTTDICYVGTGCSNTFETQCYIPFHISDVTMKEGTGTNTNFVFSVTIPRNSSVELKVYLSTIDGTAIAGSDYLPLTDYEITFPPYTLQVNVPVVVIGDSLFEGNNTFYLSITEATSNEPMIVFNIDSIGLGTILNDDNPSLTNDVYYVGQKARLIVDQESGLFSNDNVEISNNPFAIARISTLPSNGTITLQGNGSFSYQTTACYVDDRFIYTVEDVSGNLYHATVLLVANLCSVTYPTSVIFYYPVVIAWFDIPPAASNELSFYFKVTDINGVEVHTSSWDENKPRGLLPAQSMIWNPSSLLAEEPYNLTLISEPNGFSWDIYPSTIVPYPFAGYNRKLCSCS